MSNAVTANEDVLVCPFYVCHSFYIVTILIVTLHICMPATLRLTERTVATLASFAAAMVTLGQI